MGVHDRIEQIGQPAVTHPTGRIYYRTEDVVVRVVVHVDVHVVLDVEQDVEQDMEQDSMIRGLHSRSR